MPISPRVTRRQRRRSAFTLIELLVAMTVLVLLIGMIAQMTGGMASIIGRGQAHVDTDERARALLDRMSIDFAAMVKRPDVDYYLKGRPTTLTQAGNDQIAFFSEVPGYYTDPATPGQSSVSLIAYRVNSTSLHLERLSKGLVWNGAAGSSNLSLSFLPVPLASPLPPPMPANPPSPLCPHAADPSVADADYEELGPQVFRFEYYYVLKGQKATGPGGTRGDPVLSLTPWYANAPANHTSVNGMQDVAGIGVLIAVIDPKNRALVSTSQLNTLAQNMADPAPDPSTGGMLISGQQVKGPGDIEKQWTTQVLSSAIPHQASAAIRIYTRCFYLNEVSP